MSETKITILERIKHVGGQGSGLRVFNCYITKLRFTSVCKIRVKVEREHELTYPSGGFANYAQHGLIHEINDILSGKIAIQDVDISRAHRTYLLVQRPRPVQIIESIFDLYFEKEEDALLFYIQFKS